MGRHMGKDSINIMPGTHQALSKVSQLHDISRKVITE